jgi:hypothetical protein
MIARIKRILTTAFAATMLAAPVLAPAAVYAQSSDNNTVGAACKGVNLNANDLSGASQGGFEQCGDATTNGDGVTKLIKLVINIFSLVVGVVAVIMIIIGGLKYITSGGDSGNITGAKNTILYAVIGLVVVALAQFVVRFVLTRVGSTVGGA